MAASTERFRPAMRDFWMENSMTLVAPYLVDKYSDNAVRIVGDCPMVYSMVDGHSAKFGVCIQRLVKFHCNSHRYFQLGSGRGLLLVQSTQAGRNLILDSQLLVLPEFFQGRKNICPPGSYE